MATPELCAVTVDSLSKYNEIYWDKTPYDNAKNFIVYREISTNSYKPIAVIPYNSLSYFIDTVQTKYAPNTGNPNTGTYRYKLQLQDSADNYSLLSLYHNTIFINYNGFGVFSWNPGYLIENTVTPVNNYLLMRDGNNTGVWTSLGNVTGTQFILADTAYKSYPNGKWRTETQWTISCTPTIVKPSKDVNGVTLTTITVNNSRSNIKNNSAVNGMNALDAGSLVSLYPNPANGQLNIEWLGLSLNQPVQVIVRNYLGMEVIKFVPEKNQSKTTLDISGIAAGIYCLEIKGDKYTALKKLMVE